MARKEPAGKSRNSPTDMRTGQIQDLFKRAKKAEERAMKFIKTFSMRGSPIRKAAEGLEKRRKYIEESVKRVKKDRR